MKKLLARVSVLGWSTFCECDSCLAHKWNFSLILLHSATCTIVLNSPAIIAAMRHVSNLWCEYQQGPGCAHSSSGALPREVLLAWEPHDCDPSSSSFPSASWSSMAAVSWSDTPFICRTRTRITIGVTGGDVSTAVGAGAKQLWTKKHALSRLLLLAAPGYGDPSLPCAGRCQADICSRGNVIFG